MDALECYVGNSSAVAIEVRKPLCGFKLTYPDDECEENAKIELTVELGPRENTSAYTLRRKFKDGVCYFEDFSLSCICYGHLCNSELRVKEILALRLARGVSWPSKKLISCFLYRDEIRTVFGKEEDNDNNKENTTRKIKDNVARYDASYAPNTKDLAAASANDVQCRFVAQAYVIVPSIATIDKGPCT
ncbi:unnamed protein product [Heligmosomoides polygyrus]|uniref:Uncharacterized protein n=1 Tax=Heligmosomoides polygyrus TaxID=6339 RepID=A0A183GHF4_HELPZ|nr:unnamed protein product [Heligmosomoides polygyrus]